MRSSDTPANELAPQGPTDWSLETRSDDLLLAGLLARLPAEDRRRRFAEVLARLPVAVVGELLEAELERRRFAEHVELDE
jgi:hypothetical protein